MLILLDRDGVLNQDREDFIKSPDELIMIPGSAEAVARLNQAGHIVAVVSNQSGVGRGLFDEDMLARIHDKLRDELSAKGGHLDAIFYCCDAPWEATERRKPRPGMIREALTRFPTPIDACVLIGDSLRDLQAAASMDMRRILVRTGNGAATQSKGLAQDVLPVDVYEDLNAVVNAVLANTC